jgi:hypothetical protein
MTFEPRTIIRLYPAAWRRRYADEMLAMIGERKLSIAEAANIGVSALVMRLPAVATTPAAVGVTAAVLGWWIGNGVIAMAVPPSIGDVGVGVSLVSWAVLMWRPSGRPDAIWRTVVLLTVAVLAAAANTMRLPTLSYLSDVWPAIAWLGTAGVAFPIAMNAVLHSSWHQRRLDENLNLGWPPDAPKGWS